jgi:hypothetical protein
MKVATYPNAALSGSVMVLQNSSLITIELFVSRLKKVIDLSVNV